ncbi:23S rRNA (cytidine1920-2'-O)/16S rRNA (cytidine1409-2'-O)-methyltransferase [Aminivibrio pyruvatiphilus]|uniref:23S rRNA (Cytidine1920-2'-O)/16S rRNA (Cytidine1409-2'-O)-methyltransferase n=1 Tax=Aminivibrio pyruvatiphilus TaxID=1005740 RepID=A0A4R8M2H3_9BACT|nr:TlyA family RNA methyltransferase [Aminivibrio pyruvatiphilus]TDY55394.1 23S rRNA (cytidine1920-2'-O)/16S rRNA (cytidine1409-2'-O)-methyltransferase [Aminivibrio pyruvatiphilus]
MSSSKKERIDRLLVSKGLVETRSKAQALLLAGKVFVGGSRVDKTGSLVPADASIEVRDDGEKWVSRGAHKLLRGLSSFSVSPADLVCVDIGASTGGFTQVLLEGGARKVYAVDVGYGQLAWSLRNDERVVVMERTNARALTPENFREIPDLVVADASFISLKLLIPPIRLILSPGGQAILLVKPQFEVGKGRVGKGGVVRSKEDHVAVLKDILAFCEESGDFYPAGLTFSPITGPMGNIEYLLHGVRAGGSCRPLSPEETVEEAHHFFRKEG